MCLCAHMCIYKVFVYCLSAEGQKWTLGVFSKPDSKSLTREGPLHSLGGKIKQKTKPKCTSASKQGTSNSSFLIWHTY